MSQAKNWCFTLNNPTNEETERLILIKENAAITYAVFQLEKGVAGTVHFQGYLQFKSRVRLSQVKAAISPRAHIERAIGTPQQNRDYCTKEPREGANYFEFGTLSVQGKRNDIRQFVDDMKENILSEEDVLEKHPLILAKYPRFVSTTRRILAEQRITLCPYSPREGWQVLLRDALLGQPDPRRITWYFDEHGNSGKSHFCHGFRRDGLRGYIITGGRHADIYYAYGRQPVVFFDWPRSNAEAFPYAVAECFKNGYFLSTKYESVPVFFEVPHVIVFANFYPDKSKLSLDRWDIHVIDNSLL